MKHRLIILRFCIATAMLIQWLSAHAQTPVTLVLWHADGTTTDVGLYTQPRVTFTSGTLVITSPLATLEYPANEILRFTYKGEGTGISNPKAEADYSQDSGQLVFHGITTTDRIAIYTMSGIRVPVKLTVRDNGIALPLTSISKGSYILSVNGQTSKFVRR